MNPITLNRTVDAAAEPITTAEAKTQLRILHSDDDTYIDALIAAAREAVEELCHIALIDQTWVAEFAGWPTDRTLYLPRAPISSITSVKYYDGDNAEQTLATSAYSEEISAGEIRFNATTLPTLTAYRNQPVFVTYVAGYGATGAAVPSRAKQAILYLVHHFYDDRVPVASIPKVRMPYTVEFLLGSLKRRNM